MTTLSAIERFLAEPVIAVVWASRSGKHFGNAAFRELARKGYRVYAVHPQPDTIDGARCYRRLVDLPEPARAVLIVVPPEQAVGAVREAAAAGIRKVWLQQGAESPEVMAKCAELGLETIAGRLHSDVRKSDGCAPRARVGPWPARQNASSGRHGATLRRSSTLVTPGAAHAACSAA